VFQSVREYKTADRIRKHLSFWLAFVLHIILLAFVLLLSQKKVEDSSEEAINVVFFAPLPPAPPPLPLLIPSEKKTKAQKTYRKKKKKNLRVTLPKKMEELHRIEVAIEQEKVKQTKVEPEETKEDFFDSVSSDEKAVQESGAAEMGIVGGRKGGVKGGVIGGLPEGVPGGQKPQSVQIKKTLDARKVAVKPKRIAGQIPGYNYEAKRARVTGVMVLLLIINEKGMVQRAKVMESLPLLDEHALRIVKKWKFRPALDEKGNPVSVYLFQSIRFRL